MKRAKGHSMKAIHNRNILAEANRRPGLLFSVAPLILGMAFFWPFSGNSGKTIQITSSEQTPAAYGTVSVKAGQNDNTRIDLKVQALARPSSLTPTENVYVVWVQPPGHNPKNDGRLEVNGKLDGRLRTETPYKTFKLFVTAEKDAQVQAPAGPTVLSANVQAQG